MRHVTIYTTEKEYNHFIRLAKNLHYVKKILTDEKTDMVNNIKLGLDKVGKVEELRKNQLIADLTEAFEEVKQHEQGKKNLKTLETLLNEL